MSEQRFNIQQQYKEKFYQLPKVFFTNEKYIKLSNDAKIAYALLKDRLELSIKNNWFDDNGDIFFIFTNEKLKNILNCHDGKLTKIKKELSKADLLEQVRCGQGKPNKLYLKNPSITRKDVYEIKKQEENDDIPNDEAEMRKSHFKKCENRISRNVKIAQQEMRKSHTNDTDFNNTEYIKTETNDTNDLHDTSNNNFINYHSNHTNHQQTELNNDALKFQALEELPTQIKTYLSNFEIKDIRIIKSVLLKGKKSFNNAHDTYYRLEDVEFELVSVLKRFKAMLLQKNETVEAMQGYLMQSIKAELEEIHALNMRRQNIPQYNIFNK